VEVRPQPLGDPTETILEVGPELSGPLWVRLHQSLESGSYFALQSQGAAHLPKVNVVNKLLPTILQDGEEMGWKLLFQSFLHQTYELSFSFEQ